jgi:putative molybdopterin biosynthesis protein
MRGEAHIAPVHLLDTNTKEYNKSYVEKYLKGQVKLIKGVKRSQGIMLKKGNPKGIKGISDFVRGDITYVNRQKGAGTRILLDYLLNEAKIIPEQICGYANEEYTHTAVAAQIAAGNADAGLGIFAAAKLFDLDYIPVINEEYDFIIRNDMTDHPKVKAFLEVLESEDFKYRLSQLGGYEF